jgi:hypothetical protein
MISKREIKRIVSNYWDGSISDDVLETIKNECIENLDYVIREYVLGFKEENRIRKESGLREYSKLRLNNYKTFSMKSYKPLVDSSLGIEGQHNRETSTSENIEVV